MSEDTYTISTSAEHHGSDELTMGLLLIEILAHFCLVKYSKICITI